MGRNNEPLLKIEVKESFKVDYKSSVLLSNQKALVEILKTLEQVYGFPITKACGQMIADDEEKKWFEE
jgi:2-oxoglutarate dehydrogenase complex dehydrogenase (E1) component-like enzyme